MLYLCQKYDGKMSFVFHEFGFGITMELKVDKVVYIPDEPQYQAPMGNGYEGNEVLGVPQAPRYHASVTIAKPYVSGNELPMQPLIGQQNEGESYTKL